VGGFPLAIVQMAAWANREHLSLEELQEVYYWKTFNWRASESDSQVPRDLNNLASVFALDELPGDSTALLSVLSLLDGDSVLESLFAVSDTSVDLDHFPMTERSYLLARSHLIRQSLVAHRLEHQTLCIHRVVQDTVRAYMSPERWRKVFGAAVHLVSSITLFATPEARHTLAQRQDSEQMMLHVCSMHRAYVDFAAQYENYQAPEAFARLLIDAAEYVISGIQSTFIANNATDIRYSEAGPP
jgi:hypothetical protein